MISLSLYLKSSCSCERLKHIFGLLDKIITMHILLNKTEHRLDSDTKTHLKLTTLAQGYLLTCFLRGDIYKRCNSKNVYKLVFYFKNENIEICRQC